MARFEAQQLPSGSWRARANYRDEFGKLKRKSFTAPTKKEAQFKAELFLHDIEKYSSPTEKSLGMIIDDYIAFFARSGKLRVNSIDIHTAIC